MANTKSSKNWKAYWGFMLSKAFRTGLQSAISLYLANSTGIIVRIMVFISTTQREVRIMSL